MNDIVTRIEAPFGAKIEGGRKIKDLPPRIRIPQEL
tara:strand:+ start:293 stop:400 length:108 start_codon:yes stop_codon:yes gene_type:complete